MAKQSYTLIDGTWIPTGGPPGVDSTVPGPAGPAGQGVPTGGTDGQVLAKNSTTNYDTEWIDPPVSTGGVIISPEPPDPASLPEGTIWIDEDSIIESVLPLGGADGQVLTKASATDFDVAWEALAAGGSTILSGTATPPAGTGAVGDYYLDTDDRILYGPKATISSVSAYTTQTPPMNSAVVAATEVGTVITCGAAGYITSLRFWRESTSQTARTMRLWSQAGSLLSSVATTGETGTGWKTVDLPVPIQVSAGQVVAVSYTCSAGPASLWYVSAQSYPFANAPLTATSGCYSNTVGSYPATTTTIAYFTDVVFQAGTVWPIALKSPPPGGTTSQVLAKTTATDYDWSWATPAPTSTLYTIDLGAVTANTPVTVTHSLGTLDVFVQVIEKNTAGAGASVGQVIFPTVVVSSTSTIQLTFAETKAANLYRVIVRS